MLNSCFNGDFKEKDSLLISACVNSKLGGKKGNDLKVRGRTKSFEV